jgi:GNAT superfamily N-acetyltransferase
MGLSDIPFAVSLTDIEGWGFFPADFETKLKLYPTGSFVAHVNDEPAGIISAVEYGKYAFLGNLIIAQPFRGHGVGASLMQHAIDYLLSKGVTTIELDGVLSAVSLYRRLGFKDKHYSMRFARSPQNHPANPVTAKSPASQILTLDRKLTGVARRRLLDAALRDKRNSLLTLGNPVSAYALIRERAGGFLMVAPVVASNWRQVPGLLSTVIEHFGGRDLWIGVPEPQYRMSQLLVSHGFEYKEPSLRMYYGWRLDYEKHIYGIFGPAVG